MPVCKLQLLSLEVARSQFVSAIKHSTPSLLVIAKPIHWIIPPTVYSSDALLKQKWDILLIYANNEGLPTEYKSMVKNEWFISFDAPAEMVNNLATNNEKYIYPRTEDIVARTGELDKIQTYGTNQSADSLEVTEDFAAFVKDFGPREGKGPVSMFNLLATKDMARYMQYVAGFQESAGSKRGGEGKIFGSVLECSSTPDGVKEWEMVAMVHYPSIYHFGDMLAADDYQEMAHKYRFGALLDNPLLCTTELRVDSDD